MRRIIERVVTVVTTTTWTITWQDDPQPGTAAEVLPEPQFLQQSEEIEITKSAKEVDPSETKQ